jgi:DNA gyrase subunit B
MKGIGEMNPEELKETTMNPTIRKLHCITIKDIEATEKILEELMGDNPETRKKYIIENSGVADVDM